MDDAPIPELTLDEVRARIGQPGFHVYDCNSAGRWRRGHVPTATHLNPYSFEAPALGADPTATLVFYCSGPG
ncbi:MAG: rhodanese-like domain-containing protein [Deltaproteobacteria bacterium]|nr:rhodanese-like domain-containing protein [Deltaproteobacteria bacterium]